MSDEAAFLAALKANPADDTTRLVYADWLDEHNEPAKAEYLRLITRLPLVGDDVDLSSADAALTNELGATLAADWKDAAAGRFDVVLVSYRDKVKGIKRVREVLALDLRSAKGVVECAPNRLIANTPFESALTSHRRLEENSGLDIAVQPTGGRNSVGAVLFQVVAYYSIESDILGDYPELHVRTRALLAHLIEGTLGISTKDARALATSRSVIIADELTLAEAQRLVEQSQRFAIHEIAIEVSCCITGRDGSIP